MLRGGEKTVSHWVQSGLWAAAGFVLAVPLSIYAMRHIRASRRLRTGAALAAVLLSSFAFYEARDRGAIEETESETKRKKDGQSGDPPTSGGETALDGDED